MTLITNTAKINEKMNMTPPNFKDNTVRAPVRLPTMAPTITP